LREASLLTSIQQSIHAVVDYGLPFCVHVEKGEKRNYLVETLLGNNLHSLLKKCGGIFKVKTFLLVAEQMIKRLELLHRKGFIHRSVGLKKWVFGRGEHRKKLYLVGYGRSKQYSKKGEHIEYS
jgi:serine/threonine protein kinase